MSRLLRYQTVGVKWAFYLKGQMMCPETAQALNVLEDLFRDLARVTGEGLYTFENCHLDVEQIVDDEEDEEVGALLSSDEGETTG